MNLLTHYCVAFLITSLTLSIMSLFVYFKNRNGRRNKIFAIFNLTAALWSFGSFLTITAVNKNQALFFARLFHIGVILIPATFFHFVYTVLDLDYKSKKKIILMVAYIIASIFLLFDFTSNIFILDVRPKFSLRYYFDGGPIYPIFIAFFFTYIIFGLRELFVFYKSRRGIEANRVKYLFWGTLIGYAGGVSNYLPAFNIEIIPYNPFATYGVPIYSIIMAYTIIKYRLMDIKVVFTRAGIFTAVYVFVLGIPFGIMGWCKPWLTRVFGEQWFLPPMCILFIFAVFSPFIYNYLRHKAESHLLAEDLKKYEVLKNFARTIGTATELGKLLQLIVHSLVKTLKVSYGAMYLLNDETGSYVLKLSYGLSESKSQDLFEVAPDSDFVKFIRSRHRIFLYEDVQPLAQAEKFNSKRYHNNRKEKEENNINFSNALHQIRQMNGSLIMPVSFEENILGFLVLGEKVLGKFYSEADIEVLTALARSASLAIANAISMSNLKKAERELAEAERLKHVGYLSSAIGHQIRNLLGNINSIGMALSANSAILDSLKDNNNARAQFERYTNEIFDFVNDGSIIIRELTDYCKPDADKQYTPVDLREVLDKTLKVLYVQANKFQTIDIRIDIAPNVPCILGNLVALQNIFINMFNNAYDAIIDMKAYLQEHPEPDRDNYKGKIEMYITRAKKTVDIRIIDNGKGMLPEVQQKIFTPFYTTKGSGEKRQEQKTAGGTGIGLFAMEVIVKNHGGMIKLNKTEYMRGSDFLIQLPVPTEESIKKAAAEGKEGV